MGRFMVREYDPVAGVMNYLVDRRTHGTSVWSADQAYAETFDGPAGWRTAAAFVQSNVGADVHRVGWNCDACAAGRDEACRDRSIPEPLPSTTMLGAGATASTCCCARDYRPELFAGAAR